MITGREGNTYWAKSLQAADPDLLNMVCIAMLDVADEAQNEDPATLTPPTGFKPADVANRKQLWHELRANLARDLFKSPGQYSASFAIGCVNRGSFNSLDATSMKVACRAVFTAMCGVG